MAKLLYVLMLSATWAVAQTVEGTVVNSVTGAGIPGVTVELLQSGDAAYSSTTDARGRFHLEDVKDGSYTARYSLPAGFWVWHLPEVNRPFQVIAGGVTVRLEVRMVPGCRLSGRVIDGRGEAVRDAQVMLINRGSQFLGFPTDSEGKFNAHNLPLAGTYTLVVIPPPGLRPPDPEPDSDRKLGWAQTYYPGVAVPEAASKIILRPGHELSGIEMKLLAVPAYAVRGKLVNRDGKPAPRVTISLGEQSPLPALHVESRPDGAFEFPAVVEGTWRISADVESGGEKLRAMQWIEVAGRELEGVTLRLNAPFAVRGRMVIETEKGLIPLPQPAAVLLSTVSPGLWENPMLALADADGNFSFPAVYSGAYRIKTRIRLPYYLNLMRLGEVELAAPEMELSSGALPITLVYKTNGGTLRGTVEKCDSGEVMLIPRDSPMRWPGFLQTAQCDSNNRYQITAVRPGEYYAIAYSEDTYSPFPTSEFWTPNLDNGILNQASRITARAGETTLVDLRAIAQPPY